MGMQRLLGGIWVLFFLSYRGYAQKADDNLLLQIMHEHPQQFDSVLQYKDQYRLQIIYTKVDRDKDNNPHLTTYCLDTGKYYFYCASMIKLLECPLAMEKINRLKKTFGLSIYDSILVSGDPCGDPADVAYRGRTNFSTPAQMIKEMLLVSNNHAFNPIYDFLTQAYFNKRAHELGYTSATICNRFAACDTFQNRITSSVLFFNRSTGALKYLQPSAFNPMQPIVLGVNTVVGKGFMLGDSIAPPKDFCYNNYISLWDLHRLLIHLTFPSTQPKNQRFDLEPSDYAFLHKYAGMYPRESAYPVYDPNDFKDVTMKFFITPMDTGGTAPPNIRVFNKVGQAFGFMTDCSYAIDTVNKIEFFLSCTIYTNKDEILNDEIYEYETVATPFLRNLFSAIYNYELQRERKYFPKFEALDFSDTVF